MRNYKPQRQQSANANKNKQKKTEYNLMPAECSVNEFSDN